MSSTPSPDDDRTTKPEIELSSDESWKDQVRRENEKLEAEYQAAKSADDAGKLASAAGESRDTGQASEGVAPDMGRLPPPSLSSIVSIFSTQAMVALGAFEDPELESSGPQLGLARHFIDLLGVLEAKTAGNLAPEESRLLTGTLHELRMAFVEVSRMQASGQAPDS